MVTFDLDGTLTRVHGWSVIARAVHREPEYLESNRRFLAREIDEDRHLKDFLQLAEGLRVTDIESLLASTPVIDGIAPTLERLRSIGIRSALLTHNPGYVCAWYQRRYGFDDWEGTLGTVIQDGRIVDAGPAHADKVGGLGRLVGRSGISPSLTVHVGDGWADAAIFPRVGGGISFNSRLPEVDRAADEVVRSDSLSAIIAIVLRMTPRQVVESGVPSDAGSNT